VDHTETQESGATVGTAPTPAARNNTARNAQGIAIAALIIAVLAPFGEDALLGTLNIHTPMARRMAETTQTVSRLERHSAEQEKQLAALSAQVTRLQTQSTVSDGKVETSQAWTRMLALMQLGVALRHPGPFDLELAAVRASGAAPADAAPLVAKIEPYAATGIPGLAQLQRDFSGLRARIDLTDRGYTPVVWMTRLIAWPRNAVAGSPADAPKVDPGPKLIGDAAGELSKDNLPGALAVAQQVSGPNREFLTDWMEDAGARVAADDLARRINDIVVQRLSGAAGKPANRP